MVQPKYTYDGDPSKNDRDAVRWYVGDTDERRPMLDDREVDFALVANPNVLIAASVCAEALSGKFAREANVSVGGISKALGTVSESFRKHAETLRARACLSAGVSFPATIRSEKEALELDTNLTSPEFILRMGDNPWAVQLNEILPRESFNGFF